MQGQLNRPPSLRRRVGAVLVRYPPRAAGLAAGVAVGLPGRYRQAPGAAIRFTPLSPDMQPARSRVAITAIAVLIAAVFE